LLAENRAVLAVQIQSSKHQCMYWSICTWRITRDPSWVKQDWTILHTCAVGPYIVTSNWVTVWLTNS